MAIKRPLMPAEDRNALRGLAGAASDHLEHGTPHRAYAQAVVDTLRWLTGDDYDMSPLLKEVTR